ncbi:TetR/AcrR family transcriptional regulator [Ferrovibrio sp.]|uniref:TetR/AcrR family transcriptional regulator n=1 Tax=Ferrovibrio sp. TaxID=1917215 RepID=UPI003D28CB12
MAGKKTWGNVVPDPAQRHQLKRDVLIKKAADAFRRQGFHTTSMADIAATLGVTKAALYRYISSKEEILYIQHCHTMDLGEAALRHGKRHGKDGLEKTLLALHHFLATYADSSITGGALTDLEALQTDQRREITRRRDHFERTLRGFVTEGIADGSIRECDPRMTILTIMGSVNWLSRWYNPKGAWSAREVADGMVEVFAASLRAPQKAVAKPARKPTLKRKK